MNGLGPLDGGLPPRGGGKRVVAAMSGGVDSSVAAALLVERGFEVIGVTMRLLPKLETAFGCCGSPNDVDDAARVCAALAVPHYVLDLARLFDRDVIQPFVEDYRAGRTPNPCVDCNQRVKFGYLLRIARAWDAQAVATGHYARVTDGRLCEAADRAKDQTYFLYRLTARELRRVLFPVGELTKAEVRSRARALGLPTADKPESQEICFVPGRDYRSFVAARSTKGTVEPAHFTGFAHLWPGPARFGRPLGRPAGRTPLRREARGADQHARCRLGGGDAQRRLGDGPCVLDGAGAPWPF